MHISDSLPRCTDTHPLTDCVVFAELRSDPGHYTGSLCKNTSYYPTDILLVFQATTARGLNAHTGPGSAARTTGLKQLHSYSVKKLHEH